MVYENEFEGVEMAKRAIQRSEERKTQATCRHRKATFSIRDTYTQDARNIRYRDMACPTCGYSSQTVLWEEPVSAETLRRI